MGNCLSLNNVSKRRKALPIDTSFELPSPLPIWPPGHGFGTGVIDLGGLQVCQISSFNKVWATHEGGPDNLGASFYEPAQIPQGFFMLGCYSQPNNAPLYGWVLAGKDVGNGTLANPIDYTLIWSSESLKIKQDGIGYFWLPIGADGYTPTGLVLTNSPNKPSLDKICCVRSDLTDQCQIDAWIWGPAKETDPNGFNIFSLRPKSIGTQAMGVCVGSFWGQNGNSSSTSISLSCLKNVNFSKYSSMPNLKQIEAIFKAYSPLIYFHPDEQYLSSSVNWYFKNGALLYKKGEESNPVPIEPDGLNLPQGGSNDGEFWLDLPLDKNAKERVKKGDLNETEVYLHIKPTLGATFTDIATWVFCPFNGPAKAKIEFINVPLGKIGEHVGDWEHITLRISNFDGKLRSVYFSEHSKGSWVSASGIEFGVNGNKFVGYTSLHGHAMYSKPGLVLQGSGRIGIRNDSGKSKMVLDTGNKFSVIGAEYLGVAEAAWVDYFREWGPKISYDIAAEVNKVDKLLPFTLKSAFRKFVNSLPKEVLGEEGPTGPKLKNNWSGDELI